MQSIDFYKLTRAVQERFIGSVNGTGLPAPMLRSAPPALAPRAWFAASAGAVLTLFLIFRAGFGDLHSRVAIEPAPWLAAYVGLAALAVFGVLRAMALLRDRQRSPFRRGIYVFPVGLIDAREPRLKLYPIEDLANVVGPEPKGRLTLDFGARRFAFAVDAERAESARSGLASARGRVQEADAARESLRPKALAALDPLQGFANPLMSSEPLTPTPPTWAKLGWLYALGAGIAVGLALWAVRNVRSDDAMYARAVEQGDSDSFKAYLARATRHSAEVSTILLPRADLTAVQKDGSVTAIEGYIKDHPQTNIGPEIAAALKTAMVKELNLAIAAGTLVALDDFAKAHPNHHLDAELRAARHGVYQAALDRYAQVAPAKGAAELAFVQKLVAWAELKGPPVELRFHRQVSKSMDKADGAVQKSKYFKGVVSLPSRYFDAAHDKGPEQELANAVVQRFAQIFPTEILALAVGEPVPETDDPLPATVAVPTFFIEHGPTWSGSLSVGGTPKGAFVGLGFGFDALFRLPDDTKPLKVKFDVWKSPDLAEIKGDVSAPEETIYAKMNEDSFTQFQHRLLGAFFKAPGK
ncbi:MAG TPA: hypothetical protein VGI39_05080 [Polyangiaceae bacterium]|jgi:hypothetical protein